MQVFKNAWFTRFARKERISSDDLLDAVNRVSQGLFDADLGSGVYKQRIARPGQGRSKGYRSILLFRKDERCFFVYGYAKSELENITAQEEIQFRLMARHVLNLSQDQLALLMANGQFEEVN
ncbi:addiction module toxin RelE [Limnohabitans planktonicus II-D5]|uniref:Addiction module toxin RelE n=2 Tax=Limnohabitans planktonicus TaxID=540060 RepID=A0A2T7UF20_9BURK|nr:addiction module toxin RelE [Limnohabitans planktonicus II-D5]|eukprot:gene18721-21302_t